MIKLSTAAVVWIGRNWREDMKGLWRRARTFLIPKPSRLVFRTLPSVDLFYYFSLLHALKGELLSGGDEEVFIESVIWKTCIYGFFDQFRKLLKVTLSLLNVFRSVKGRRRRSWSCWSTWKCPSASTLVSLPKRICNLETTFSPFFSFQIQPLARFYSIPLSSPSCSVEWVTSTVTRIPSATWKTSSFYTGRMPRPVMMQPARRIPTTAFLLIIWAFCTREGGK